jgi:hypothetical protein
VRPLIRRRTASTDAVPEVVPASEEQVTKGRPTPKRRDVSPRRAPITEAPRNRKQAAAWQRQQRQATRPNSATGKPMTTAERREAMARGEEAALPRTHQGPTRKLARDYVDSRRMFANFLLLALVLMALEIFLKISFLSIVAVAIFVLFLVECYVTGRKIVSLSRERGNPNPGSPLSVGFYAGSRAYLPRRFRLPRPQVKIGDPI